jgi:hypothetical protein
MPSRPGRQHLGQSQSEGRRRNHDLLTQRHLSQDSLAVFKDDGNSVATGNRNCPLSVILTWQFARSDIPCYGRHQDAHREIVITG